jgi:hypothetical protein
VHGDEQRIHLARRFGQSLHAVLLRRAGARLHDDRLAGGQVVGPSSAIRRARV